MPEFIGKVTRSKFNVRLTICRQKSDRAVDEMGSQMMDMVLVLPRLRIMVRELLCPAATIVF